MLLVPGSPRCRCGSEALALSRSGLSPLFFWLLLSATQGLVTREALASACCSLRAQLCVPDPVSRSWVTWFRPSRRLHCRGSLHPCTSVPSSGRPRVVADLSGKGAERGDRCSGAEAGGPPGGAGAVGTPHPTGVRDLQGRQEGERAL